MPQHFGSLPGAVITGTLGFQRGHFGGRSLVAAVVEEVK
jgi:hypothetical protein